MASQDQTRSARLESRIAPEALAVVRRAAEIQGRSVSDFVIDAALNAAHRAIAETEIVRLTVEGQRELAALLLKPPAPSANLKKAFKRRRELLGVK